MSNGALLMIVRYCFWRVLAFLAVCVWLSACTQRIEVPKAGIPARPEGFASDFYEQAQAGKAPVYKIVSEDSLAIIRAFSGGKMAHLGHDHVIASRDIQGFVLWSEELRQRRADLYIAVNALTVDEPELRARYGMKSSPSDSDIEKTRHNMLNSSIESFRYPFIVISLTPVSPLASALVVAAKISLHGVTRTETVAVAPRVSPAALRFTGNFSIKQSDYGIQPFTALGGLLVVRDELDISFDVYARVVR
jgi:polyisoprenoid-binding protein YceI